MLRAASVAPGPEIGHVVMGTAATAVAEALEPAAATAARSRTTGADASSGTCGADAGSKPTLYDGANGSITSDAEKGSEMSAGGASRGDERSRGDDVRLLLPFRLLGFDARACDRTCLLSSLPSALELVMNLVDFLAGTNFVFEVPHVLRPNMH